MTRIKKLTDEEFVELMVNKAFEIIKEDITYSDLICDKEKYKNWFSDYSFNIPQYLEWKKFFFDNFYKWKPKRIKPIDSWFSAFSMQYGLKYDFSYKELEQFEQNIIY